MLSGKAVVEGRGTLTVHCQAERGRSGGEDKECKKWLATGIYRHLGAQSRTPASERERHLIPSFQIRLI